MIGPYGIMMSDTSKREVETITGPKGENPHTFYPEADPDLPQKLKDIATENYFRIPSKVRPAFTGIRRHIPLKSSSRDFIAGHTTYCMEVDKACQANDRCGRINMEEKEMLPPMSSDLPVFSYETYGREAFGTILHLPPLCTFEFVPKENSALGETVGAYLLTLSDTTRYAQELEETRWLVAHTRHNITAVGDGKMKLNTSREFIQNGQFSHEPNHHGSPEWVAIMLQQSDIDPQTDLTVHLPNAILLKYHLHLRDISALTTLMTDTGLWSYINDFRWTEKDGTLILESRITGRKLTFVKDENPVYVEVQKGEWFFQEMFGCSIGGDGASVMPGKFNSGYGKELTNPEATLAAIVTISAGNAFHKEPMPNSPVPELAAIVRNMNQGVPDDLLQEWVSTMDYRMFSGPDCELYVLQPWIAKMKAAGHPCDKITPDAPHHWFGGYVKSGAVYVEDNPRQCVNLLLKMPDSK